MPEGTTTIVRMAKQFVRGVREREIVCSRREERNEMEEREGMEEK